MISALDPFRWVLPPHLAALLLGHQCRSFLDQNHALHDSLQVHRLPVGEHLVPKAVDTGRYLQEDMWNQ